jgi:hypothetical protein
MPYIDKTPVESVCEALDLWRGVSDDPMIDGYNGWGCKQKIYKTLWKAQEVLEGMKVYHGEEEWVKEQKNPVLIYESPDKGKTVYARRQGETERFLVKGEE